MSKSSYIKIFFTVFAIVILLFSLNVEVDNSAMGLHNEAFERSMVAFTLAKGLNAVISLIQGTELSFSPMGVGLNLSVGEILDPLNDMVERFSWVMLFATVSLGVQKLLLILSAKAFLHVALFFSMAVSLFFLWYKKLQNEKLFSFSIKILLFVLVLRFGAVLFVYTNELVYNSLLKTEYVSSTQTLQETKTKLDAIENQNKKVLKAKKDSSWYELDISSKYQDIKSKLNVSEKLEAISKDLQNATKNIINLITIFIVQSLIMPLIFLWFMIFIVKWIFKENYLDTKLNIFIKI